MTTEPFEPTRRGDRLHARGAADAQVTVERGDLGEPFTVCISASSTGRSPPAGALG